MSSFLIPLPRSDDGTILPALLVGILTATLVLCLPLSATREPEVSDTPIRAAANRPGAVATIDPSFASPAIRARPIFAPSRIDSAVAAPSNPFAGAQVAGSWSVGRQTILVLRLADGRTRNLGVGGSLNQWVLAAVTADGAHFVQNGKRTVVPYGGAAPQVANSDDPPSEEEL